MTPKMNKLYKLFGRIKKNGINETIYVVSDSEESAIKSASEFADNLTCDANTVALNDSWNFQQD